MQLFSKLIKKISVFANNAQINIHIKNRPFGFQTQTRAAHDELSVQRNDVAYNPQHRYLWVMGLRMVFICFAYLHFQTFLQ